MNKPYDRQTAPTSQAAATKDSHPDCRATGVDVPARIVDELGFGARCATQENPAHTHKRLGIGAVRVGVDDRADALGEVAFAAQVGGDGTGWRDDGR
jgi:hypothetical protein